MDHTAELELEIEAPTEEAVFADALTALAELLASAEETEYGDQPGARRAVSVAAEDRPALLAAWMEELVFLAETEGFEPAAIDALELGPCSAEASVTGRMGRPRPLVKAVTYHRLSFGAADDGYRATVVLDV
jgi:SHS2 domain-containing protein